MRKAVIVSAVRTPLCKNNGDLADADAMNLASTVIREAVARSKVDPENIEEVMFGNLRNREYQTAGRVFGLGAGLPVSVPGILLERACASSLTSLAYATMFIEHGQGDCYVVGGVESCTNGVYTLARNRKNLNVHPGFAKNIFSPEDPYENLNNGETAERVAERFHVTREECDRFAYESHMKASEAEAEGRFDEHIVPVVIPNRKGNPKIVTKDTIYRPDCTMEALAKLPPAFVKGGIVTAGNSSPITDGASAMVIMEEDMAKAVGAEILGRCVAYQSAGCEPCIMGMGPMYATRKLMARNGYTMDDFDLIEINEAFASQSVACMRELNADMTKVNVNGGAIALGHPFTASGGILTARALYELRRRDLHRALVTFCIGGGMGVSVVLERD